jgi:hypothetical protein
LSGAPGTNYNAFGTGCTFRDGRPGSTLTSAGSLAQWRARMNADANSLQGAFTVDVTGHLPAGSPAINAGTTVSEVTSDIDGQARQAPYDIGADEYGQTQSAGTRVNGSQPMIRGVQGAASAAPAQSALPLSGVAGATAVTSLVTRPASTSGPGSRRSSAAAGRVAPVRVSIQPPIMRAWIRFNRWLDTLKREP